MPNDREIRLHIINAQVQLKAARIKLATRNCPDGVTAIGFALEAADEALAAVKETPTGAAVY